MQAKSVSVGVSTAARIPSGATVERIVENPYEQAEHIVMNVREADFTTTNAIVNAINRQFGNGTARAIDPMSLAVRAPEDLTQRVANRKAFESKLDELGKEADAGGPPVSIVLCDIDFFKRVNDSFGHQTGDQVIRFVATVMTRAAPQDAMVARLGGEEFAILMAGYDLRAVGTLAERVRKTVETKRLVRRASNEDLGQITVSLGYAMREGGEGGADFVDRADAALYASKRGGRNRSTAANPLSAAA